MKRRFRLTRSTDFKRVRRFGKSYAHPLVALVTSPGSFLNVRISVVASKHVGNAVMRNRVKRRMRVCMDVWLDKLPGGQDIILLARPAASRATFGELQTAIASLLNRAGLVQNWTYVNITDAFGISSWATFTWFALYMEKFCTLDSMRVHPWLSGGYLSQFTSWHMSVLPVLLALWVPGYL